MSDRAPTPRVTALIVACALFMQNLDGTVIATALPTMAHAFGVEPVRMSIALTSYMLSLAIFIPASGWMADRFGARNVFRAAIAVFTIGSILCGRADTLAFLVAARILQGIGGAMMIPVGRLVLLRTVPKSELVSAMAWLTIPSLVGPVIGPPLGGLIVTYTSWRWIFDINVPIGIAGIVLVTRFVQDVKEPPPGRFDGLGLVLSAITVAGLMFGLETAGHGLAPLPVSLALVGTGLLSALLYRMHARRAAYPLLDFSLMRVPTFAVSVVSGTLFRLGVGALPFLLPLMLQLGFGESPVESGMVTFMSSAGALVMKPVASPLLRRLGFRRTLLWNALLSAVLIGACGLFRPSWPSLAIYAVLLVGGFVRSLQFTAYNTIAYADLDRRQMSAATSLYSTIQQLSLTLGITAGAAALEISALLSGRAQPGIGDYGMAFLTIGFISALAAPASAGLARDAGAELTGGSAAR